MVKCDILDRPMTCCGMIQGSGFSNNVLTGKLRKDTWNPKREYPEERAPTYEDLKGRFQYLISHADELERNCALVSLSDDQQEAMKAAEEMGFKKIFEFYNPNSGNQVHLYTYTKYDSHEDYKANSPNYDEDDN